MITAERSTTSARSRFAARTDTVPGRRPLSDRLHALDPELVAAAANGDSRAIAAVLSVVHRLVLGYARARRTTAAAPRNVETPEDLAQEVCLRVLQALPRWKDRGHPFAAYVHGIAAHTLADAYRATRMRLSPLADDPHEPFPADDPGTQPEQRGLRADLCRDLRTMLARLTPRQREILVLRVALGLTAAQTASIVGCSPGAVRIVQHRALAQLRHHQQHPE